jgi:hypothetical protein
MYRVFICDDYKKDWTKLLGVADESNDTDGNGIAVDGSNTIHVGGITGCNDDYDIPLDGQFITGSDDCFLLPGSITDSPDPSV